MELKIKPVFVCKGFLTNDCLHCLRIFSCSIKSIQLICYFRMINSCHLFTNSMLHETWKGRQHVNWGVNTSFIHCTININLTFSNIASKIRDWMSNIIVRHCENRNLSNWTCFSKLHILSVLSSYNTAEVKSRWIDNSICGNN